MKLFLCGDVMIGRGIDQALPRRSDPILYESFVRDARDYVWFAEKRNGPIRRPLDSSYVWGDLYGEWARTNPAVKIVNLETALTLSGDYQPGKGIHYRAHPENAACLQAAGIVCCTLANNHVLDWGSAGLEETLTVLERMGAAVAGAGRDADEARRPALVPCGDGHRVAVLAAGSESAGIPRDWGADGNSPGVRLADETCDEPIAEIAAQAAEVKRSGDVIVFSIHWGGNWGYEIPPEQVRFARRLIDEAGVDIVFGHSSYHPKAFEIYRGKLILYGCGDLINDYEGIERHSEYGPDLTLGYFPEVEPQSGLLKRLELTPLRRRRFRLELCNEDDLDLIESVLKRECGRFGLGIERTADGRLVAVP